MTAFLIPFVPGVPQRFTTTLGGTEYQLTAYWCRPSNCWVLDIADSGGTPILTGIPVVTGCNLLEQYAYLNFGGSLVAQTSNDAGAVPTFNNLGDQGNLFFVTT